MSISALIMGVSEDCVTGRGGGGWAWVPYSPCYIHLSTTIANSETKQFALKKVNQTGSYVSLTNLD